jgi:hypothetical protein
VIRSLERLVDGSLQVANFLLLTVAVRSSGPSRTFSAAFAAIRPSVNEPDENLWAVPPMVSPAPKRPSTVIMRL